MKKDIILKSITEKANNIKYLINGIEDLNYNDETINKYHNELKFCYSNLLQIIEELTNDVIPESFYDKINNTVSIINIEYIFSMLDNSFDQVSEVRLKSLCENNPLYSLDSFITYKFYKDLGFFTSNIVVVGANGSGKSTLVNSLKTIVDEKEGVVIPAQKLLIIPTFDSIPNYKTSSKEYDEYQNDYTDGKTTYNASKTDDIPYSETLKYGAEYKYVLKTLIAERAYKRDTFCTNVYNDKPVDKNDLHSKLDIAIEIWNSLIEHREMYIDTNNTLMIKDPITNNEYPAYKMSDGEKNILYLIGRVLLAKENALIIIDEPEMYLHKSIVHKLWDKLEKLRKDSIFIYLTHDLDFASSRVAQKYWIKDFKFPMIWDIEKIPENEIPENLLMKLLGSRKKILFCEGKKKSLDTQILEVLFPDYTITSVSSCKNVINYVRSFNQISNKNVQAIGLIDRDFRTQEQLEKLKIESIFSYQVAEIENLFLIKEFVEKYADYKKETIDIQKLENKVLKLLEKDIVMQSAYFLSSSINYNFSESHIKKGNNFESVKDNLNQFIANLNMEETFKERENALQEIVINKKYDDAIMYYNNKGLLSVVEDLFSLKSNTYRNKALYFLKVNKEVQEILKSVFPDL